MRNLVHAWTTLVLLSMSGIAAAAAPAITGMSAQDYDFYSGDFNGDGYTDLLFIAKDPSHSSGIILSDGSGLNIILQTWGNAYLGIPWTSGLYTVIVADFNGDGKADIFLQRNTPGDSYLLLTEDGGVGAITQTIANTTAGVVWSADQHHIIAGDFNGDGRADLFLQATDATGLNAIMVTDANGQFTSTAPAQSWNDGYLGFNWATTEALIFSGDFNGDKHADLLVQALPAPGTGPGTSQQAFFPPNLNGVVLAQPTPHMFTAVGVQSWSRDGMSADWSPLDSTIAIGDFNGDGRSDVLLQGINTLNPSYLLYGSAPGPILTQAVVVSSTLSPNASSYRLLSGHFDSTKGDSLLLQGQTQAFANYTGHFSGSSLNSALQTTLIPTSAANPAATGPANATTQAAIVTANAAGRTPGQFAVSPTGAATYTIPIWTPPGARGIAPHLSLVYLSGGPDGTAGPGWSLAGLSGITRCNQTVAENGTPAPVTLTTADNFCLDGNRLRLTSGTYGVAGSTYQTEIANFSNITAYSAAGNGPSYFIVQGKDGLYYEYGNTVDSKAYASGGSTPYSWLLNKIRDRQGNNLTVSYSTTTGYTQPSIIQYTQTPQTSTTYPYSVSFAYQNRVTNLSKYVAGGNIVQSQILSSITVNSSGTQVRQYNLAYTTAPTTVRDRLATIQECAGTSCLQPTTIAYQDGTAGIANPNTTAALTGSSGQVYSVDVNGDGKTDLLYSTLSGSTLHWYVKFGAANGTYGAPVDTGFTTTSYQALVGDFYGNGNIDLVAVQGTTWYVVSWNGTTFVSASTGVALDPSSSNVLADTNGDGRSDLVSLRTDGYIYIRLNMSSGSTPSLSSAYQAYNWGASPVGGAAAIYTSPTFGFSKILAPDFNGDGRQDIVGYKLVQQGQGDVDRYTPLISNGTTFSASASYPNGADVVGFANVNNDACTDIVFATYVRVSACDGVNSTTINFGTGTGTAVAALDWDGDGRQDIVANVSGSLQVFRSLGSAFSTAIATGYAAGNGHYLPIDPNGDGLEDLAFLGPPTTDPVTYGLHNGGAVPPDYATSITDGWGINASPTYVPISQSNYTKYADATFPDFDFQGPMYVVNQDQQSDGTGGTFTNSFWYYGAHVNRQGRAFGGFYATQTTDSRNGLIRYVYYQRAFPFIGAVFEDDVYQPDGATLISHTVNTWTYTPLVGSDCSVRCFPYASVTSAATHDVSSGGPLVATTVRNYTYDSSGNVTQVSSTITDNNPSSPFYNQSWLSVVSNTITPDNGTNWCLDKPTSTTTQNTVPGQAAQTRRVDHQVDYVNCRFTQETVEPSDPRMQVTSTFAYAAAGCGNMTSVSVVGLDQNGASMAARTTTLGYGTHCEFVETLTNPLNQNLLTAYQYDIGAKSSATDSNGVVIAWLYDGFGRRTKETRPDGTYATWTYANCTPSNCTGADLKLLVTEQAYDSGGNPVRLREYFYDGLERLRFNEAQRIFGTLTIQSASYDSLGRKVNVDVPYSAASNGYHHFTYDLLNRPNADQLYDSSGIMNRQTIITYAGLSVSTQDAKSNITTKTTDVTGRIRQIVDPSPGGTTKYTYDPFGNLITIVDPNLITTSYTYNIRGFKTSSIDSDSGSVSYIPDSLNELVSQTDAKGQTISYGYDLLGRTTSRLEPESATPTTWTYGTSAASHNIGRLQTVAKPDGYGESYSYDSLGRPQTTIYTEDTTYQVDYTYNALGTLDTLTYPTSTSGYRFAAKYIYSYGYLQQVKDNATGAALWSLSNVNDSGLPTTEVLGNGATVGSTYTPWTNDLTSRIVGTGGVSNNLQNLSYSWDLNQNLQQRVDVRQNLTEIFVNDAMNRVTSSTLNGVGNLTLSYDAAGDITSKSDVGGYDYSTSQSGCTYYSYAQPHAVRNAGGTAYCYDANGNIISRAGSTLSWFSFNQPNTINYGSNSTQFKYDSNHNRWMQSANFAGTIETTYYIGGLLEKLVRSSTTEYRHQIPMGSGLAIYTRRTDGSVSTYYVASDHLGSGDVVMDSSANVLARESFTPFGARRGSNWQGNPTSGDYSEFDAITRRGFTNHEMLDGVSLIHMNGRVYDPYLGRFLSPDRVIPSIGASQSLNPFSYVMDNPLTLTDPSGLSWFSGIENFIRKFWRPILAIVVAIVAWELAPYLSAVLTPAGATAAGTVSVSVVVGVGEVVEEDITFVGGGVTIIGGAAAGAIGGAVAGGILGGWHGALSGAISGAIFGAVGGYYGSSFGGQRVVATAAAGGASSSLTGGSFWRGAEIGGAIGLLQWAAYAMREDQVKNSQIDARNSSGTSDGMYGDHFKLGGGRWADWFESHPEDASQPFGGSQGGGGTLFGIPYSPGGAIDHLIEAFAGPHDWISQLQYNSNGDLGDFWTQTVLGRTLGTLYGGAALAPAAVFVGASTAPELAYVKRH
jgi:RHS repeat-associated protein